MNDYEINFNKCKDFIQNFRIVSTNDISFDEGYRTFYNCYLYNDIKFVDDLINFLKQYKPTLYELQIIYDLSIMLHKHHTFRNWFESYQIFILPLDFKCYLLLSLVNDIKLSESQKYKFDQLSKLIRLN